MIGPKIWWGVGGNNIPQFDMFSSLIIDTYIGWDDPKILHKKIICNVYSEFNTIIIFSNIPNIYLLWNFRFPHFQPKPHRLNIWYSKCWKKTCWTNSKLFLISSLSAVRSLKIGLWIYNKLNSALLFANVKNQIKNVSFLKPRPPLPKETRKA